MYFNLLPTWFLIVHLRLWGLGFRVLELWVVQSTRGSNSRFWFPTP